MLAKLNQNIYCYIAEVFSESNEKSKMELFLKQLTALNRELFFQKSPSWMFDQVLTRFDQALLYMMVAFLILRDNLWTPSVIVRRSGQDFTLIHAANLIKEILVVVSMIIEKQKTRCVKKLKKREILWLW